MPQLMPPAAPTRSAAPFSALVLLAVALRLRHPRPAGRRLPAGGQRLPAGGRGEPLRAAVPVPEIASGGEGHRFLPDGSAGWAVLLLASVSMLVRPVVELLSLPTVLNNLDALLTPPVLGLVALDALLRHRTLSPVTRWLLAAFAALVAVSLASWAVGSPRSVTSLALTFISLLLLPSAVVLVALVDLRAERRAAVARRSVVALKALVLLQVLVCSVQYVVLDVAAKAPVGADLVDGTTSHNFWPTFALPAAAVLLVIDRGATRWLWPLAIAVLAVYAEAKAAMIVFVPLLAVLLAVVLLSRGGALRRRRTLGWDLASRAAITVGAVAVVLIGLVATPSAQSTWEVFVGHTRQLGSFVEGGTGSQSDRSTLRDAATRLGADVPASVSTFVLGLGPGNSVSHAAEVMVERSPGAAGPVAEQLLTNPGDLQFEDAQSSTLGLWGDLGLLGVLAYLAVLVLGLAALLVPRTGWRALLSLRGLTLAYLGAAVLGGGLPLDWPEQGSVVLPLALVLLVVRSGFDDGFGHLPAQPVASRVVPPGMA